MKTIENLTDAKRWVDWVVHLRWILMIENRCPWCEGIVSEETVDDEDDPHGHLQANCSDDCPVRLGHLEDVAKEWHIQIGTVMMGKIVNGTQVVCLGPIRVISPLEIPENPNL